jgi:hypothetical protein
VRKLGNGRVALPKTRHPRLNTHDLRGTFFAVPSGAEGEKGRLPEGGMHD